MAYRHDPDSAASKTCVEEFHRAINEMARQTVQELQGAQWDKQNPVERRMTFIHGMTVGLALMDPCFVPGAFFIEFARIALTYEHPDMKLLDYPPEVLGT